MSTSSVTSCVTVHTDDVTDGGFAEDPSRRHSRKNRIRDATETVLIGDSTIKHVDNRIYMGRAPSFIQRASTTSIVLDLLETWRHNDEMKYAVLRVGLNDVRDGLSARDISDKIKACFIPRNQ